MSKFINQEEYDMIMKYVKEGHSHQKIADKLNRPKTTITGVINRIEKENKEETFSRITYEDRKKIESYLKLNISLISIGKLIGRHPASVTREVNINGGKENYNADEANARSIEQEELKIARLQENKKKSLEEAKSKSVQDLFSDKPKKVEDVNLYLRVERLEMEIKLLNQMLKGL